MKVEQIAMGDTLEAAVAAAKAALNAPADAQIFTEIIELPKKKTLGLFGGSPAKVKAYYEKEEPVAPQPAPKKEVTPKPKAQPKKAKTPAPKPLAQDVEAAKEDSKEDKAETFEKREVDINSSKELIRAVEYVTNIVHGLGIESVEIKAFEVEANEIMLELSCGEDYGVIIGKWGETLDAIQYLTRLAVNRIVLSEESLPRISINVGDYRQKRSKYLQEFAVKKANNVRKYGRRIVLDPMNPYERRIVHTAIQAVEGVTSHSVGHEGERKVVITLEKGFKPSRPQSRGNVRGRGRSAQRPQNTASVPNRAPKTDEGAKSVGLYGKLN